MAGPAFEPSSVPALVTGGELRHGQKSNPVIRHLLASLPPFGSGDVFRPKAALSRAWRERGFTPFSEVPPV